MLVSAGRDDKLCVYPGRGCSLLCQSVWRTKCVPGKVSDEHEVVVDGEDVQIEC